MKDFEGWNKVTLHDLLVAYRKAKADCFFENTFPFAAKFAEYELDLVNNLEALLENLRREASFHKVDGLLGHFRLVPKKLHINRKKSIDDPGHVHFSSSKRSFSHMRGMHDIVPDFRVVGDFPVNTHVLSALWINFIGHKFDEKLESSCYGARLRRVRPDENAVRPVGDFHVRAVGSFPPYFQPYQRWRGDGLRAIRRELESDKDVIAVSLDLKSYYHTVDPTAICRPALIAELGVHLTEAEQEFNLRFSEFLGKWSEAAVSYCDELSDGAEKAHGGLVIGLTASRVISNVVLHKWDVLVRERLAPIHYGRYVDDMFIVLRDTGTINSGLDFMKHLARVIGEDVIYEAANQGAWRIDVGAEVQGDTCVLLQPSKQKLFVLQGGAGGAGIDLLDSIESEIDELSSEHRLMPSPDDLERSPAAKVLSAAGVVGDSADTLRRADHLTIRRLSWALQLRHVETLAKDLPPKEWVEQRAQFYEFAKSHILRPDTIFAHFNYIPRLLGFAISLNEWDRAGEILVRAYAALDDLATEIPAGKAVHLNGVEVASSAMLWVAARDTLTRYFADATIRFFDYSKISSKERYREGALLEKIALEMSLGPVGVEGLSLDDGIIIGQRFRDTVRKVAQADLAKRPYKAIFLDKRNPVPFVSANEEVETRLVMEMLGSSVFDIEVIGEFLASTENSRYSKSVGDLGSLESLLPYVFPTRALTATEISELAPKCVGVGKGLVDKSPSVIWAKYTRALRGVWVRPTLLAHELDGKEEGDSPGSRSRFVKIGTGSREKVVVAVPSIATSDYDWAAMACGRPNLSRKRYQAIAEIVNNTIKLWPRPDYLVMPELSLPIEWVDSMSSRLSAAGVSLVAGTEYRHCENGEVLSEACLVLSDNRLGFPSFVKIWQPKLEPAVNEDKSLVSLYGKRWKHFGKGTGRRRTPVYVHNGVHFGVMICSELQNSKARVSFQGAVDALMVLCWNQDLETFSSLVESAALDVHAYTVLVNNRKYGDSRVRVPAKRSFDRDLARIRGGENDFLVAATLDIAALRAFQSRSKRWPQEGDKYKPVPEGFMLRKSRFKLPTS